ncbi:hypothetical protein B0A49_09100 [Cryomyces minteri]|uniref:Autophagy-related protein 13 n=1 Tax=Cryomyces minteri TaxID=331657 RepID=A0A4U0X2P5_9PEZI|nr:hypothetical protein B0A49_09100 [Cryomyces minteri]
MQFNTTIDETEVLYEDLSEWTTINIADHRPPPLYVEIYLDTAELKDNRRLVLADDDGQRHDITEIVASSSGDHRSPPDRAEPNTQVILERWKVELGVAPSAPTVDLNESLANLYKKGVVLFRSLFTYARFLPAWKYLRSMAKLPASQNALQLHYRIVRGGREPFQKDMLNVPLVTSHEPVTEVYNFGPISSPAGPLSIEVTYRTNTKFQFEDHEALLSSRLMGEDAYSFSPSLASGGNVSHKNIGGEPGSLPIRGDNAQNRPDRGQAYGSMSTFHQVGPATGSSPISALRAARDNASPSPTSSLPQKMLPNHRTATGSKSSLRTNEGGPSSYQRRTSVSFQPFKAGSLSSSPAPGSQIPPSPGTSLSRPSNVSALSQARNRNSLTTIPQQALRTPSLPNETAIASSASSSPKPAPITRYSSSFSHRRSRFSSGGGSRTEEDNVSSGRGSASSAQPGSGVLNEGEGGSSGSVQTDEDNISDFLKLLEQKKELKSFNRTDSASRDAASKRTAAAFTKYSRMRDSNAALSDSLSSSLLLHRSSTSSSQRLSNVPPMIAGTSVSTSSSLGKPISPHTPHTPAIPSRLSANSIIDYSQERTRGHMQSGTRGEDESESGDAADNTRLREEGTNAIDIPLSPRTYPHGRRSSSVAQQQRTLNDDDVLPFGMRSTSLPVEERTELSLSQLLHLQESARTVDSTVETSQEPDLDRPASRRFIEPREETSQRGGSQPVYRPRFPRDSAHGRGISAIGRGLASAHGSSSSLGAGSGPGTGSGTSDTGRGGSRFSFTARAATMDDDEPLLFAMSDFTSSRRSLEEGRGGSNAGSGIGDRAGAESGGGSRRGNRRAY